MNSRRQGLKQQGQKLARTLGSSMDELTFYSVATLRSWQRRPHHTSDVAQLETMRQLAQISPAQLLDLPAEPVIPQIEIQNQKMPLALRTIARNYRYTHLTFASAVKTGVAANDIAHAHHLYRPDHKNAPTLLYLHGWHNFDAAISLLTPLRLVGPLGFNVVMLELPHHMHRAAPGTYSGELSLTANLPAMLLTVRQAISDTRAVAAWLRARGISRLALEGQSLGGALAALTLTVEGNFECAVLFVPAVEPLTSLWHSTYTRPIRNELVQQGLDEATTRAMLDGLRPGRYRPLLDPKRILVVAATGDRVAFHQGVQEFAQSWQTDFANIEWGHLSSHWTGAAIRQIRPFLGKWLA